MRVRPFFWLLLTTVCIGVLVFAGAISIHKLVPMQAHIDQVSTVAADATAVRLRLTDSEGMPIDQAIITPHASMPAMQMAPQRIKVQSLGQGVYLTRITFSMAGAWKIDIIAHADGFDAVQQSLLITV
jgi:nitrogen fixation protein FixH